MNLMSLRSKTSHDTPLMHTVQDIIVPIPGSDEKLTVRQIFNKGAKSKRYWNKVKLTEVPLPTARVATPVASPLIVGAEGKTVKALLESLRAQRDQADAAIVLIEKNL
jgi:hypothetical protein